MLSVLPCVAHAETSSLCQALELHLGPVSKRDCLDSIPLRDEETFQVEPVTSGLCFNLVLASALPRRHLPGSRCSMWWCRTMPILGFPIKLEPVANC